MLLHTFYRGLALAHRQVRRLDHAIAELAVALHPPGFERIANKAYYAKASTYQQPHNQHQGLFPFECRALDTYFPLPPAHLLVPGAGGGREVLALIERGYRVDAFDPVQSLVDAANHAITAQQPTSQPIHPTFVRCTSLEDWSTHPTGRYDAIFTGWATWTHLLSRNIRLRVLQAFQQVCRRGPVLLSFWRQEDVFDPEERKNQTQATSPTPVSSIIGSSGSSKARFEAFTRDVIRRRWLRLPPIEPGTVWNAGLFVHCVSELELVQEAASSDYAVAFYERDGSRFPNAVLLPVDR